MEMPVVSLLAIGRAVRRDWRSIAALALVGGSLTVWRDFTVSPTYRSEVLVAVVNDEVGTSTLGAGNLGALASLAGVNLGGAESRRAEYLALLQSRRILAEFIRRGKVMPLLFPNRWDSKLSSWRRSAWRRPPTEADAEEHFRNNIMTVVEDKKTGLVSVRIDWRDPVLAATWANGVVALLNEQVRQQAVEEARMSVSYLNQELAKTTVSEVRQSINRLMESRLNKIMVANVQNQYALRSVDPALPADPMRPVKPRPVLDPIIGTILGFSVGLFAAVWRRRRLWLPG